MVSRQRIHQMMFRDRTNARAAVTYAIKTGKIPRAAALSCVDCGEPAHEYDHWKGYEREHRLDVQPVCVSCHSKRPRNAQWRNGGRPPGPDFGALVPVIEAWRAQQGLNHTAIAARLGMSLPLWSQIRSGRRRLGVRYARAFAQQCPDWGRFVPASAA